MIFIKSKSNLISSKYFISNEWLTRMNFYREKILSNQVVVVSIFGKSSHISGSCKADIIDKLLGYSIFKKCMLEECDINEDILVSKVDGITPNSQLGSNIFHMFSV